MNTSSLRRAPPGNERARRSPSQDARPKGFIGNSNALASRALALHCKRAARAYRLPPNPTRIIIGGRDDPARSRRGRIAPL
jgi:hypothetical protein